jgi:site-specific DNA recombinase
MLSPHAKGEDTVRVATYTRISTDEAHQPYSLEAQETRLDAYMASQEGWEHVASFTDQLSGATLERPGIGRALAQARAGRFDVLLVYRTDRLSRSVRGLAQVIEDLDAAGVAFRSATEPFDTQAAAGRMMVQMLGVFAEFERATIIDRVIAGMERKAAQGGWCGGHVPLGYRAVKGEGRLEVERSEATLVALIFDRYVRERLGSHAIATALNEAGYRTRAGRPWSYKSVLTVLRNRTYLGEVHFRGEWHASTHPPLVDHAVFEAAQTTLHDRGSDHAKRAVNGSDYLLSGLVVCAACGQRFSGTRATGRNSTYRYYTCGGRQRYGRSTCNADRLPADALDAAVVDQLLAVFADGKLFARAGAREAQRSGSRQRRVEAERASLDAELKKIEDSIDRYLQAFEAGTLPEAACAHRIRGLREQSIALGRHRDELDEVFDSPAVPPTPGELSELASRVREAVETGAPAIVKELLRTLIHEIRVESRRAIRPVFRVPEGTANRKAVRAKVQSVDLLGAYSNHSEQGERLRGLLKMVPSGPPEAVPRTIRRQRRLSQEQVHELIDSYRLGICVNDLAAQFEIHRSTVFDHVNRAGIRRRYPAIGPREVEEAAELYRTGQSLRAIGIHFGVHASTVGQYLVRAGIKLRDCQGRER